jgi:FkbH-like protein
MSSMKARLKDHMLARRFSDALHLILRVGPYDALDDVEYAAARLDKIPPALLAERAPTAKKLAILGGATTHFLVPLIRLFAFQRGVLLTIYESGFGLFEQEIWGESPTLRAFEPDIIHFHVSSHNLGLAPVSPDPARVVADLKTRYLELYRAAAQRFGCALIVNNFETSSERALGSLDGVLPGSRNSIVRALNEALVRELPPQTYLNDIEQLSSVCGKDLWCDARLWHETKTALSFACHPHYAHRLSSLLGALAGKSKKCLVLDLDNTLWGGVIGDDGLDGIKLGAGQPAGEAFVEFQMYVKALKERGILLAVASKNEADNALLPFRQHSDMALKESDISCFVANWGPKDQSLRRIAEQLNIGLDSLVFFDDNPAERDLVSRSLPAVTVIDVPADPSLYVQALDKANLFDMVAVTSEDRIRAEFFQDNQAREQLIASTASYEDFLRQLHMRAVIEPVTMKNLARVAQLINKTNQFNLTTRRMTEAQVQALVGNPDSYTSTIRLDDKFGANGLISVVIGAIKSGSLEIENWLMSCRVLKRGVEFLEMQRLVEFCRNRGLEVIIGRYLPTAKNDLVRNHYAELGFELLAQDAQGSTWKYRVGSQSIVHGHHITVHAAEENHV